MDLDPSDNTHNLEKPGFVLCDWLLNAEGLIFNSAFDVFLDLF